MTRLINIVLVDDLIAVSESLELLINSLGGFKVVSKVNSGTALLELLKHRELPDLVLLDARMPGMDGLETLVEVRKHWPELKVLVFTSMDSESQAVRMFRSGANGYLLRNCHPDELSLAIRSVHEEGFYYNEKYTAQFVGKVLSNEIKTPRLTPREMKVAKHIWKDLTDQELATLLDMPYRAVTSAKMALYAKFSVRSKASLVMALIQEGIIQDGILST